MAALGFRGYWDGYFAGRSAPLGRVPAEVVHAAFYNFAEGEVARHIPEVWDRTTPEAAHAARQQGCAAALRRILGDLLETPGLARAAELLARASTSAPTDGRVMYAGLRALPMPEEPVTRLWYAANMLREHRGDGHIAALVSERIGGTEAHVLSALDMEVYPAESFGRIHHLPKARLARSWTACATVVSSMPQAASPMPGVRPRTGSRHRPMRLRRRRTTGWSRSSSRSLVTTLGPHRQQLQATGSE